MIYWIIEMQDSATISQFLFLQSVSLPLMFVSVIVVLLFKHYKIRIDKILLIGVVVFIVYYFTIYGFGVIERKVEDSIYTLMGYILLFIVFPFIYMLYLLKKLDVVKD